MKIKTLILASIAALFFSATTANAQIVDIIQNNNGRTLDNNPSNGLGNSINNASPLVRNWCSPPSRVSVHRACFWAIASPRWCRASFGPRSHWREIRGELVGLYRKPCCNVLVIPHLSDMVDLS